MNDEIGCQVAEVQGRMSSRGGAREDVKSILMVLKYSTVQYCSV